MEECAYFEQIKRIFKMTPKVVESVFFHQKDIDFYFYYRDIFANPKKLNYFQNSCRRIFSVTNAKSKKVLDVGCGFGLDSIYLGVLGGKVVGIDVDSEKLDVFKKILTYLHPPLDEIEVKLGDVLELSCKEKFDIIICNDVISHVRDLDSCLNKAYALLNRNGLIYIRDGNNKFCIQKRHSRRTIWRNAEPQYKFLRKNMIRDFFNLKQEKLIERLAEKTAGLYGEEIFQAVDEYLSKGIIERKKVFRSRNPLNGFYLEREFSPFALKKRLHKMGFSAKILRPYFTVKDRSPLITYSSQLIKTFHPFSIFASPQFEILAEKV